MNACMNCGGPMTRSEKYCPSCGEPAGTKGKRRQNPYRTCDVTDCCDEANIVVHGVGRCWRHYREQMDGAGKRDWRDAAIEAEATRLGLTPGRPGEGLKAYMRRHGINPAAMQIYQRIPGEDDDV